MDLLDPTSDILSMVPFAFRSMIRIAPFKTGKSLRQGGPLSPFFFNLVADALAKIVSKATDNGLIIGLLHDIFHLASSAPMLMIPSYF